jgi:hypothetical protein
MQTDQGDSPADLFKPSKKILPEIKPCRIWLDQREEGEPEAKPCQNPSLYPFCLITATNANPQWVIAIPANPLARPHLAEMPLIHPTLAQGIAMATVGTQTRQSSTDHRPSCHLAARPATTHRTNSPSQFCSSLTVQCSPSMPA